MHASGTDIDNEDLSVLAFNDRSSPMLYDARYYASAQVSVHRIHNLPTFTIQRRSFRQPVPQLNYKHTGNDLAQSCLSIGLIYLSKCAMQY